MSDFVPYLVVCGIVAFVLLALLFVYKYPDVF